MISVARSRPAQGSRNRDAGSGQSLSRYLEEISHIPLLTRDEELRVAGSLTEAREQLLLECAKVPEAVEEICRWARKAASGDVCFDRYFDFIDSAPLAPADERSIAAFTGIVDGIQRNLARLRRWKAEGGRAGAGNVGERLQEKLCAAILRLHPTEPIITRAEDVVRQLQASRHGNGNGNGHGNGNGNGNGHGHSNGNGNGNGHGHGKNGKAAPKAGSLAAALVRIQQARHRFEESRRILTESNLRLAIAVAKHYRNRGLPLGDLIQEGNLGLIRACDRFDSRKGYRFSTYAVYWIRQSISRALPEQGRTVRVPPHLTELLSRFYEAKVRLTSMNGREPSQDEIARVLGVSQDKVARAQSLPLEALSLDRPLGEDGTVIAWDLPDTGQPSAILAMQRRELESATHELPAVLSTREAQVIEMRFGLCGRREMTLEEIGRQFSVTRERIRQIQAEALRKLRSSDVALVGAYARTEPAPSRPVGAG